MSSSERSGGLQAVVWDYDGTLVDTEPIWASTEQQMMLDFGVEWGEEQMRQMTGQSARISAQMMADAAGLPERVGWFFDELHARVAGRVASAELPYLDGVLRLLAEFEQAGIRCALVTASNGQILDAARSRLPSIFEFLITSDDVAHPKPHPEGYLQAFARLGVDPLDALILEDSVPGTRAGLDAGGLVVGVPSEAVLPAHPRLHVSPDALRTTGLAELRAIHERLRDHA